MRCILKYRGQAQAYTRDELGQVHPDAHYMLGRTTHIIEQAEGIKITQAKSLKTIISRLKEQGFACPEILGGIGVTGNWKLLIVKQGAIDPDGDLYFIFGLEGQKLNQKRSDSLKPEIIIDMLVAKFIKSAG